MKSLRALITCFILGFSSGLPLALVTTTLQAWFTVSGIDIIHIGLLSLVAQPYVYKFIWAPTLDQYRLLPKLSYRKDWILFTQILIFITAITLSFFEPQKNANTIAIIAVLLAFFSATQDIAIDAYRTEILSEKIRGLGASIAVAGYRLGIIVSGGLALIMADQIGWKLTYQFNAFLIFIGTLGIWIGPILKHEATQQSITYFESFKELITRKHIISLLILIIGYRFGETFTYSVSGLITTFLLRENRINLNNCWHTDKVCGDQRYDLRRIARWYFNVAPFPLSSLALFWLFTSLL